MWVVLTIVWALCGLLSARRQETRKLTLERVRALWKMFYGDGGNLKMREARLELAGLLDPSWFVGQRRSCAAIALALVLVIVFCCGW